MGLDPTKVEKIDYSFFGIFRGIVEDDDDPLDSGRVRVRIFGIHSFDGNITTVHDLPWALPAIGLTRSGGKNIDHKYYPPSLEESKPSIKDGRYDPGPNASFVPAPATSKKNNEDKNTNKLTKNVLDDYSEIAIDPILNSAGTGGDYVVPAKGSVIFLFFENGDHETPVYFAMAPSSTDWSKTKQWRNQEVASKFNQITEFKEDFIPREESVPAEDSWASEAYVNSLVDKPKLDIKLLDDENGIDLSNRDIQCVTSANGTTIIIDNRQAREQIFLIHKNYMENTDHAGNRKIYIGKQRNEKLGPTANDPVEPCNYEIGVEGNHDLHILGEYRTYVKGNVYFQCDSFVQIDAQNSVGLVVREGDVDLLLEKGNLNADVKGNVNVNSGENVNIKVDKNANILVKENCKLTVSGDVDVKSNNMRIDIENALNIKASDIKIQATNNIDCTCETNKLTCNVDISKNVTIGGKTDISGKVQIGNSLLVSQNISCGGSLSNKGRANLGSPVIAHGLQVISGTGTGRGGSPRSPASADQPEIAQEAQKQASSISTDKSKIKTNNNA